MGTVITKKGRFLLAKLASAGEGITFTRASVGAGRVPAGVDPSDMISLNDYRADGVISTCTSVDDTASITFQIHNDDVATAFMITEAAVFATDPDQGEILYAYLDMTEDPQYIYASGSTVSKFIEMTLDVIIGEAQHVTAIINPKSFVLKEDFDQLENKVGHGLDQKVNTLGGDASETIIKNLIEPAGTQFPVPAAGESLKSFLGKIKKFAQDFRNWHTGVCMIGNIVNNCVTNRADLPLSAAQGKALMDLYSVLNSNFVIRKLTSTQESTSLFTYHNLDVRESVFGVYINFWITSKIEIKVGDYFLTYVSDLTKNISYVTIPLISHMGKITGLLYPTTFGCYNIRLHQTMSINDTIFLSAFLPVT